MSEQTEAMLATLELLREEFPAEWVKGKPIYEKGNKVGELTFVPWYRYVEILNETDPTWSLATVSENVVGNKLVIGVALTINGVTRINYGDENVSKDDYGTAVTNAWAQAFKRACALFGLGLYMYYGTDPLEQPAGKPRSEEPRRETRSASDNSPVLKFGRHRDKTVQQTYEDDASYVQWLASDKFEIKDDDRFAEDKWAIKAAAIKLLEDGFDAIQTLGDAPKASSAR